MELNISEQNKESIKVNKSSVGIGWELKFYRQGNETDEQMIARLKKVHLELTREFPNGVKK